MTGRYLDAQESESLSSTDSLCFQMPVSRTRPSAPEAAFPFKVAAASPSHLIPSHQPISSSIIIEEEKHQMAESDREASECSDDDDEEDPIPFGLADELRESSTGEKGRQLNLKKLRAEESKH